MPDRNDLTVLPRTYRGAVPAWPLPDSTERELELWAEMWTRPQATVWAQMQSDHQVALHVRTVVRVEENPLLKTMARVAHRQAVALLLTPTSLRRAGYRISPVELVDGPKL